MTRSNAGWLMQIDSNERFHVHNRTQTNRNEVVLSFQCELKTKKIERTNQKTTQNKREARQ